jgi:hypothetical protein
VLESFYPGSSNGITFATATMSLAAPQVPDGTGTTGKSAHSIAQIWVTSGFGYNDFGYTCTTTGAAGEEPCTQSLEAGWDVEPNYFQTNPPGDPGGCPNCGYPNSPHLFVFSTNDGYEDGCWDSDSNIGDCLAWIPNTTAMVPGMELPSTGTLYLEPELIPTGSSAGWWLFVDIDASSGYWLGYVPLGEYWGPMLTGAQEYQVGAEVYDNSEGTSGNWTTQMGNGMPAANAGAAYFTGCSAVNTLGAYVGPMMGPVTRPTSFVWAPYGAAGNNGFTYGSGAGFNWSPFQILSPPSATFVPTLTRGSNAITLAPTMSVYDPATQEYELDIYGLLGTASGSNHQAVAYSSYFGVWEDVVNSAFENVYLWGVTTDRHDGALWGWGQGGTVYTTEPNSGTQATLSNFDWTGGSGGMAAGSSIGTVGSLWATGSGNCSGPPAGKCVQYFAPSGTFPGGTWEFLQKAGASQSGAEQLVTDAATESVYALDSSGNVWALAFTSPTNYSWTELKHVNCSDGSATNFDQIAAKSSFIFGLGPGGSVYYYTSANGCWSPVGSKTKFAASIATGDDNFAALWATDTSGQIWTAE